MDRRPRDLVVIDRSVTEFAALHIRGPYNVPLPPVSEHTHELTERLGEKVVPVCQSGVRQRWDLERQVRLVTGSPAHSSSLAAAPLPETVRRRWVFGTGLMFSGVTNTCAMGKALAVMPGNKTTAASTADKAIHQIPRPSV